MYLSSYNGLRFDRMKFVADLIYVVNFRQDVLIDHNYCQVLTVHKKFYMVQEHGLQGQGSQEQDLFKD